MKILSRGLLAASLFFGFTYPLVWGLEWPPLILTLWKGAGVGFLALAAMHAARGTDGILLAIMLACGAVGDILLVNDLIRGALAFAIGHGFAIWLYARNRRARLVGSQKALAITIVPVAVLIAWALPADRTFAPAIAFYTLIVAAMAAMAWTSRFSRYRTGLGAMLFLISDLFIFARMGPLAGAAWTGLVIWLSYYCGQLLIFTGVRSSLSEGGRR